MAGKKGDRRRRSAKQKQRDRQLRAAAIGAVDRREDHRSGGPGDKGERKDRERPERAFERIEIGEDQLGKDQHRGDGIDEKVEEFGCAPDDHANRDLARPHRMAIVVDRAGIAFGLGRGDGVGHHGQLLGFGGG